MMDLPLSIDKQLQEWQEMFEIDIWEAWRASLFETLFARKQIWSSL